MVQKRAAHKHHKRMTASSYTSPSKLSPYSSPSKNASTGSLEAYARESPSECSFHNDSSLLELSMQTVSECGSELKDCVSDGDSVASTCFDTVAVEVLQHNMCPFLTPKDFVCNFSRVVLDLSGVHSERLHLFD